MSLLPTQNNQLLATTALPAVSDSYRHGFRFSQAGEVRITFDEAVRSIISGMGMSASGQLVCERFTVLPTNVSYVNGLPFTQAGKLCVAEMPTTARVNSGIPFASTGLVVLASPANGFQGNEQGVWLDPSDLSTLFQDSAGTTPVTAVGQPVGLILDKRLGAVRGANAAPATTSTTGWTSQGGTPLLSSDGTSISIENGSAAESYAQIDGFAATTGQWYEVTATVDSYSGGASGSFVCGTFRIALGGPGAIRIIFQAPSAAAVLFGTSSNTTGAKTVFRNASLRTLAGNHATQATAASRPTLSARYNLLTETENLASADWGVVTGVTTTANAGIAPDGTMTADSIAITDVGYIYQSKSAGGQIQGKTYVGSITVWSATKASIIVRMANTADGGDAVSTLVSLTSGFNRVTLTRTFTALGTSIDLGVDNRVIVGGDGIAGSLFVWGADVRTSADASLNIPAYQRVTTASNYDTAGFPHYLSYDGVDDSMATGSVDFSATDKMTVWVGVHKAAEGTGIIYELTADTSATNGALDGYTDTGGVLAYGLRATVAGEASTAPSVAAPASRVSTASYYLSGASAAERLQVRLDGVAQTLTGVAGPTTPPANFANAPLYIGRRGGSSLPFNGRLYSLIVRGAASSAAQIAQVERFVASRMGVSL